MMNLGIFHKVFERATLEESLDAVQAAGLTAVGITRRYAPLRYLALVVFGITVLKVFIVDFSQLDSVYRIVSSVALGLLLMGASYLYQRYDGRLGDAEERDEPAADG